MKILLLGSSSSRSSGGIFHTTRMLGQSLTNYCHANVEFLLYDDEYSVKDRKQYCGLPLHTYALKWPKKLGYSNDLFHLLNSIKPDVVHTQGIWMYLSFVNRKYNIQTSTPYVISPHGMLDPWQLKQSFYKDLKKNIVLALYESKHLKKANCIHALCDSEYNAIRSFGLKVPVAIIPNGVSLPLASGSDGSSSKVKKWAGTRKTLLFLSRIHQKKGLDNLLQAWALSQCEDNDWQLVVAGETRDTEYLKLLLAKVKTLGIERSVQFIGGQYDDNKENCYLNADAFILPSFSEGLPMAVLEAWSYKLPAILTPYCNLPEGFSRNAAIEVDTIVDGIASGIRKLVSMRSNEREEMGKNGYNLVVEKFTWEIVARSTMRLYEWISGKGDLPDFVR